MDVLSVDDLLNKQEEEWDRGNYVSIEELLAESVAFTITESAVLDLICNERRLRADVPELELEVQQWEYRQRFPDYREAIDRQFACERALLRSQPYPNVSTAKDENFHKLQIPNYQEIQEHDRGGFGIVYRARQILPEREVAIKLTRDDGSLPAWAIQSLHNEATRVARLRHMNIVEIYEVGTCDGLPYFVMPFVNGGNLSSHIDRFQGQHRAIARLLIKIAGAVNYAHTFKVFHCDLKPQNILLENEERPLLTDFGLAVTLTREVKLSVENLSNRELSSSVSSLLGTGGTLDYMAPEQRLGRRDALSPQTDVYGLGAILHFLLTGSPPRQVIDSDAAPSPRILDHSVPYDLDAICRKCLHSTPEQRYSSAEAVIDDLEHFLAGRPVQARSLGYIQGTFDRLTKWAYRSPYLAILIFTIIVGAVGVILLQLFHERRLVQSKDKLALASTATADTLFQLSQMAAARGSKVQAAEWYRSTLKAYEQLATQYPDNPWYILQLVRTRNSFGNLLGDLQWQPETEEKEMLFQLALSDLAKLKSLPNPPPSVAHEEGNVYSNLGYMYLRANRFDDAVSAYTKAEQIRTKLVVNEPTDPTARFAVAKSNLDFGNVYREVVGRTDDAILRYRAAIGTLVALLEEGRQTPEIVDHLQQATMNLAMLYVEQGHPAEADRLSQEAVKHWEKLLANDPKNASFRHVYAAALTNLGSRYLDTDRLQESLTTLTRAEQEYLRVMRQEEIGITARGHCGVCQANLSSTHYRLSMSTANAEQKKKSRQNAREIGETALRSLREWSGENPKAGAPQLYLAGALITLGHVAYAEEKIEEAEKKYKEALDYLDGISTRNLRACLDRLSVLNALGRCCIDLARLVEADQHFSRGIQEGAQLAKTNPTNTSVNTRVMFIHDGLGLLSLRNAAECLLKPDEAKAASLVLKAEEHFTNAISCGEASRLAGNDEADRERTLCGIYVRRAVLRDQIGNLDGALADSKMAVQRADQSQTEYSSYAIPYANFLAKKGNHASAVNVLDRLGDAITYFEEGPFNTACAFSQAYQAAWKDQALNSKDRDLVRQSYLHKAMASLRIAERRGFFQRPAARNALLKDDELSPIRNSREFKTLINSLPPLSPASAK